MSPFLVRVPRDARGLELPCRQVGSWISLTGLYQTRAKACPDVRRHHPRFISLSTSRPNLLCSIIGNEGDHHVANEIIGACGLERVVALYPASRARRGSGAG